jgi:hypothetical protein
MSKQIEVTFTVDVQETLSDSDIVEWIEFELGARGSMSRHNLACGDIDAYEVQVKC